MDVDAFLKKQLGDEQEPNYSFLNDVYRQYIAIARSQPRFDDDREDKLVRSQTVDERAADDLRRWVEKKLNLEWVQFDPSDETSFGFAQVEHDSTN